VLYQNKIWVSSSANGLQALYDVWTLDVGNSLDRTRWGQVTISGAQAMLAARISYGQFGAEFHDRFLEVEMGHEFFQDK
jgi:hypothetical protein